MADVPHGDNYLLYETNSGAFAPPPSPALSSEEARIEALCPARPDQSVAENHESAMNPRLFLGTVNRGSEARFLPLAIHYSFPREQNVEPFPRHSNNKLP